MKMKPLNNFACLTIIFLVICLGASGALGASGNCPAGIAAYWELDETSAGLYTDAVGANDGNCTVAGCTGSGTGTIGNAQFFDGSTDGITVSADAAFNWSASQSFTVELWMQRGTSSVNGFEAFIGRADSGLDWYIGINSTGNAQALLKAADGSGPGTLTVSKDLRSDSGTWHHVALVRDAVAKTNTLYVDGDGPASQSYNYTAGFTSDTAPLTMGSQNGANRFSGGLDEVAVYTRALSADEIRSHYYVSRGYCSRYDSPLNIMAMGDSITKGVWNGSNPPLAEMVGYRLDLWDLLNNNLYLFNYIGSQHNGAGVDPNFDDEHAGFGGMTAAQLYRLLWEGISEVSIPQEITYPTPYLDVYNTTEIILLHIGTNSININNDADVADILDQIDAFSKNITVLVARIILQGAPAGPEDPDNPTIRTFNDNVEALVNTRIAQGDKLIMVDMQDGAGLNYTIDAIDPYANGDMYEDLHPNPSGYNKMAAQWFNTLETILPQSEVPQITTTALDGAVEGQAYSFTVTATGPPSPTFALIDNPPAGMTIDGVSGLIQWAPDAVGDYDVTVQAQNWTGTDTQTFIVSVSAANKAPVITGQQSLSTPASTALTITLADLLVTDPDNTYPTGFTLSVQDGSNYTRSGAQITPADGFEGTLTVPVQVNDGQLDSNVFNLQVTVTAVDNPPPATGDGGGGGGGGCFVTTLF